MRSERAVVIGQLSTVVSKMSKTLVIVGCGAAKRDEVAPAKNLYTSTYFHKKREFAEQRGDFWQILSAEHGLLSPELEIPPYDTTITDLTDAELDQLAHEVGVDLIDWVAAHEICGETVSEIIILAGKSYIEPLREREAFAAGIDERVSYPLQENDLGGIGEQMAWLGDRTSPGGEQSTLIPDGGVVDPTVEQLGDVPVCTGCGLMSHVEMHNGICAECWMRANRRVGGGTLKIQAGSVYHDSVGCKGVQEADQWRYVTDEDVVYATTGDSDMRSCEDCLIGAAP